MGKRLDMAVVEVCVSGRIGYDVLTSFIDFGSLSVPYSPSPVYHMWSCRFKFIFRLVAMKNSQESSI